MAATVSPQTDLVAVMEPRPYISWPAVFAGNAVTGGLFLVLLPLGAAAGLAMTSAYADASASGSTIGLAAILWLAFMYLFSISAGGYVVGRLRPRVGDATADEVRFRDGINGLVFWGVGMILSALFTFFTLTSVVGKASNVAGQAMSGAVATAANAVPTLNTDYISDVLLRSASKTTPAGTAPKSDAEVRAEIGRILMSSATSGQIEDQDRQYLATVVAQRTGLSEADAKARVDEGLKRATELKDQALAKAQAAAEAARKAALRAAFWTAVLSLLSGIAATFAARAGGQHRDEHRF
jgi:hypothetical protein